MMMAEVSSRQSDALPEAVSDLVSAICNGHVDRVIQIIDSRNTVEDTSTTGYSAIHYAAINNRTEILKILIRRGFKMNARDKLGYTPLHLAASQGHLGCATALLEASCSVNSQENMHGNTAVHEAAWNGFSQTLQELVKYKADVNLVNKAGFSALHLSSQNGHNECSRILLFAGCDPNYKNSYGDTALHTAARYSHAGVTRILLIAKCRVNEQNQNGDTALHIAAALKLHKITTMLLQAGCNANIINMQNERACDIAKRKGHGAIANLLYANTSSSPLYESLTEPPSSSRDVAAAVPRVDAAAEKAKPKKQKWSLLTKKSKSKEFTESTPSSKAALPIPVQTVQSSYAPGPPSLTVPNTAVPPTVSIDPSIVLRSFQLHQLQKHRALKQGTSLETGPYGDANRPIPGILGQCTVNTGVQYYRDLAGNIKQGPIGYMPGTSTQHSQCHYERHINQPPMASYPSVPAAGVIQNQFDHLSFLRSRHTAGGHHFQTYEQPVPRMHEQRLCSTQHHHHHHHRQNITGAMMPQGSLYRSKSDETLSTASSYQLPPARGEHCRNSHRRDASSRRQKSRNPVAVPHPDRYDERFTAGNSVRDDEICDRYKKSRRKSESSRLRKKTEKLTSTSSESGANMGFSIPAGEPAVDIPSRIDATSNPDSGYGGSKACLESAAAASMHQLTLSDSSSFQNEDLKRNGSENMLTSSTDNASVVSSTRSGSVVSLCNSL